MAILRRTHEQFVDRQYIAPSKPQPNASIESFNNKLRDERLFEKVFSSLAEARIMPEAWRHDYDHHRPTQDFVG